MGNKAKVLHNWNRGKMLGIKETGDHVHQYMLKNSGVFPDQQIFMDELEAASTRLGKAWKVRKYSGGKVELAAAKKDLMRLLNLLAKAVDDLALGDEKIILQAGFVVGYNGKHKAVRTEQPETPKHRSIIGGSMHLRVKKVAGAKGYCWILFTGDVFAVVIRNGQIILPPNSGAIIIPFGGSIERVEGLESGKLIHIGVMAINAAGISVMSNLKRASTI